MAFLCRVTNAALGLGLLLGGGIALFGCGERTSGTRQVSLSAEPSTPASSHFDSVKIEMTGHDFKWISRYAGRDGRFETSDDIYAAHILHVPQDADIEILLKSRDYIYSLEVPHEGIKEIAVPDMDFSLHFRAQQLGEFVLPGDQMCGYAHPDLMATLIVETQDEFARWLKKQQPKSRQR